MEQLMEKMLEEKVWAVVGASANSRKFGYKVFKKLNSRGYRVYPVNPNCNEIDGIKCYRTLKDLPELPGAVSLVVPPAVGFKVMEEAAQLGIRRLWFQPGAESQEIINKASELGLEVVYNSCVLIALE